MSFDFDLTAPFVPEFSTRDQMEHRHKVFPVQLIAANSNNPQAFRLNENALNAVLGHREIANKKIVIISVAGAFRKGKSFLLNFFLEYLYALQNAQQNDIKLEWLGDDTQLQGFHWRSGAKRDTVGIWLWGEPIMIEAANGEKYAVVLMDTQGTFDNSSTLKQCTTIFGLSTLLSSLQCYNVVDNIPEDALQHLTLFVEYGRLALKEAQDFGKPFQQLTFVVRDFKSPEEFPYSDGGSKFLEQVLQVTPDQPEELRVVREQLKECFDTLSCFLLPHPGYKVAEQGSFKGYVKDIRPLFREEAKRMTTALLNPQVLQPKLVNGKEITCKKMIDYIREFSRVFENNLLPEPRSILNANAQLMCVEAAMEAKTSYCRGMDRSTAGPRMMSEKKLLEAHIKHGITALNIFDKCPKIGDGEVRSANLARLQEDINAELEKYKRLNEDKRVTGCASALLACGDSIVFGLGLGGAASSAVVASVFTLQMGIVSAGIVAIPISLSALFGIWCYVTIRPLCCDDHKN
uniref:GB1/RHD3-type G domain-containing protein n=1 Tax=Panagrellus redivivus TaxID=6233 RepID=A0A7E4W6Q6_PANRE